MSIQNKLNQATSLILEAFAMELSKHKLQSKMTPEQIMAFFDMDTISVSIKSTPAKKELPEWEGDIDELPGGIKKSRALGLLALAQAGVPDGSKVHTQKVELFKPNKQHKDFYTKGVFSGPQKDKDVIKWLCKQGEFGAPEEPEVVAELPMSHKWDGDKKNAAKLIKLVDAHKKKAEKEGKEFRYVSWETSRGRKADDDNFLYNDEFEICGSKEHKSEFLNLIAWLTENADFVEKARKETTPKTKKAESSKSDDSSESESEKPKSNKVKDDESDDSEDEKPKSKKAAKKAKDDESDDSEDEKPKSKKTAKKAKDDESDDSEDEKPNSKKTKNAKDDSDDEKPKDDDSESDKDDGPTFVLDYDQKKVDALKTKLKKLETEGSEKYINAKSRLEIGRTDKSEKKFKWLEDIKVAIPIESEYITDDFIKMLNQ